MAVMFPELFRVPWFDYPIPAYGVLLALSFLAALFVATRLAERDGFDRNRVYDLALYTIGASLVGSKLLMVITEPWLLKPEHLFSREFWGSGGVYFGGFLGAFLASILLARLYGFDWWGIADAFAPAIAIGQAIGRVGCFAAGCCWGTECSLPWGVEFTAQAHTYTGVPVGVHLHPVQMYESILTLGIFGLLLFMRKHKAFTGQIVLAYLILYSGVRFTLEFWRDDPRGDVLGLTSMTGLSTSQLIALVCGVGAAILVVVFMRRRREPAPGEPVVEPSSDGDASAAPAS